MDKCIHEKEDSNLHCLVPAHGKYETAIQQKQCEEKRKGEIQLPPFWMNILR